MKTFIFILGIGLIVTPFVRASSPVLTTEDAEIINEAYVLCGKHKPWTMSTLTGRRCYALDGYIKGAVINSNEIPDQCSQKEVKTK